jgi:hypothetical protein
MKLEQSVPKRRHIKFRRRRITNVKIIGFFPTFSNLAILHISAYEAGTKCSETSAYKIQTPGNYQVSECWIIQTFSNLFILYTYPLIKLGQSVPKRRHIKFRRRGITKFKIFGFFLTFSNLVIDSYLSAYEAGTKCSEASAYKIQKQGNYQG